MNKCFLCSHLNISPEEVDILLQYYHQWLHDEIVKESGRANVVKTFVQRHEFLTIEQQATLLNISSQKLNYYLSSIL